MKRFRFGVILLALLLAAGIAAQSAMARIHLPIAQALDDGDTAGAVSTWVTARPLTAALADHQPMEDIECLFAQLEVCGEESEALRLRRELARKVRAMAEAHKLDWGTFF